MRVPGIASWKGVIKPCRESDGLSDLMDLFNTSITLAGASDKNPADHSIDGIDRTWFLVANEERSHREKVYI